MKSRKNSYDRRLAAQYLRKQLKQLASQFEGIRGAEHTEAIHYARVASRRLHAALRMCDAWFSGKMLKRWRKEIRRLTKELGDARDKDVQIEFVSGLLCALDDRAYCPGIARLLVKLERAREALQREVLEALDHFQTSGVPEEISVETKALIAKTRVSDDESQRQTSLRRLGKHLLERLDEFLPHQESLTRPDDQAAHHAMRIAAKHLRYTMEICKPAYEGRLEEFLAVVKEIQGLLGEIHDCDVWVEQLDAFLEDERERIIACYGHEAPLARLEPGIAYFREDRKRQRAERFERLVVYWRQLDERTTWSRLRQLLSTPLALAREGLSAEAEEDDQRGLAKPSSQPEPTSQPQHPNGDAQPYHEQVRAGQSSEYPPSAAGSQ